jgi:potassium/hydrogen antiporter
LPWVARLLGVSESAAAQELAVDAAPLDQLGADLLQVRIPQGSRMHGVYLRELRLPRGATVSLVVRGEEAFTPEVETRLREHDQLLVVTAAGTRGATRPHALTAGRAGPAGMMVG